MFEFIKHHQLKTFVLFSLLYWFAAVATVQFYADLSVNRIVENERQDLSRDLTLVRSRIEAAIYEDVYLADSLATILMVNPEFVENNWESVASQLIKKSKRIRNIGIAPNDIITKVYPLEGNAAAIGLNFRSVPKQYQAVLHARKTEDVYLDGPVALVQGGTALIARYPIFLDFPINTDYWGIVSVVLRYDDIIDHSGLKKLSHIDIAMKRKLLDHSEQLFYGNPETFPDADLVLPIYLPNNEWTIAGKLHQDKLSPLAYGEKWTTYIFGISGSLVLYISILMLFRAFTFAHNASMKDELTHLYNRRFIFSYLDRRLRQTRRNGNFALISIDLNDFKKVNDYFGHEAGDKLLKHVAKHLQHTVKLRGFAARMGGDEFLLVLEAIESDEDIKALIERLNHTFSKEPLIWQTHPITPSLSFGFSVYRGKTEQSVETLLREADEKMYQYKLSYKMLMNFEDNNLNYTI